MGFSSYSCPTGEVYGRNEDALQTIMRKWGGNGVPTTGTLPAFPVTFCADVCRHALASIPQKYNVYCQQEGDREVAERSRTSEGGDLDALVEKTFFGPRLVTRRASEKRFCWRSVHCFQPWATISPCPRRDKWCSCGLSPARCNRISARAML